MHTHVHILCIRTYSGSQNDSILLNIAAIVACSEVTFNLLPQVFPWMSADSVGKSPTSPQAQVVPLKSFMNNLVKVHTVHPEILAVIKFGDLPEIWQKSIIGGI